MDETHTDGRILGCEMAGQMLCTIDGTMLTSGTAEAYRQTGESSGRIGLDMRTYNSIHVIQETDDLTVILKESDHRLIHSCKLLILLVTSRIVY